MANVSRYARGATKNAPLAQKGKSSANGQVQEVVVSGEGLKGTSYADDPDVKAVKVMVAPGGTVYEYPIYNQGTDGGKQKIAGWKDTLENGKADAAGAVWHNNLAYATDRKGSGSNGGGNAGGNGGGSTPQGGSPQLGGGPRFTPQRPWDQYPNNILPTRTPQTPEQRLADLRAKYPPIVDKEAIASSVGGVGGWLTAQALGGIAPKNFQERNEHEWPMMQPFNSKSTNRDMAEMRRLEGAIHQNNEQQGPQGGFMQQVFGGGMSPQGMSQTTPTDNMPSILETLYYGRFWRNPIKGTPLKQLPAHTPAPAAAAQLGPRTTNMLGPRTTNMLPAPSGAPTGSRFFNNVPQHAQGGRVSRYAGGNRMLPPGVVADGRSDRASAPQPAYGQPNLVPGTQANDQFAFKAPALGAFGQQPQAHPGEALVTAPPIGLPPNPVPQIRNSQASGPSTGPASLSKVGVSSPGAPNPTGLSRYAPQRDTAGYAMDAVRMGLAMLPTKQAPGMKFQPLQSAVRPVGVNEGAFETARNQVAQGVRAASTATGSSMADNTAMRLGAHAVAQEANSGIEMQRAGMLQQDQQRHDQQRMAADQYNNQGQNAAAQWNTQAQHMRVAATEQAKAQSMQQSQQNIATRRATENSFANQMTTQAAFGGLQAESARLQQELTNLEQQMGAQGLTAEQLSQLSAKKQQLLAQANNLPARMQQAAGQIGWETVDQRQAQRSQLWSGLKARIGLHRRGGTLSVGDRMAIDNNRSSNRKEENALKHIQSLQKEIITTARKAGIPQSRISRYLK